MHLPATIRSLVVVPLRRGTLRSFHPTLADRGAVLGSRGAADIAEPLSKLSWAPRAAVPSRSPSRSSTARNDEEHQEAGGSVSSRSSPREPKPLIRISEEEVSYSIVIESCARKGDARGAAGWLEEMASSAFKPNVFVFNAVIAGFARKGESVEAAEWFDRMVAEGLEPNVISYTAVIDGCAKAGDAAGAARWFDDMVQKGIAPNTLTYNAVINSFARCGDVDGALKWLGHMPAPDAISYSSAINSCANARPRRVDAAESLFREMQDAGLEATASTLTALERAVGTERSEALCASLGVDPRRLRSHRPPPVHRHVRPLRTDDGATA